MGVDIVNLLSKAIVGRNAPIVTTAVTPVSDNPFANPFVAQNSRNYNSYAKNSPVQGGYFAGYYNGRANIVGQRLFVEA